ncbi:MAG: leucine--tRNA ligase [bacterium]|nr:leucine--tRNA ligase [bacterium]MDZ4285565.1 leucine--tRNA ligase [Candidatus Sungbacteria bacterium]
MSRYFPQKIEKKWQAKWLKEKVYEPSFAPSSKSFRGHSKAPKGKPDFSRAKKPFYNLMMFPYPSAEGLHIGSVRTFTGVDMYGRLKRMQGYDVFEPIGLDGFGINSENYALKIGEHPMKLAKRTEKNFYRQLGVMGNGFAWEERLETYSPEYYRWTQWVFVQMFTHGLAYRKKSAVNWCPSCKTVLADEQVIGGNCERCGSVVIKRELEQWFFRITKYADRLLSNLEKIDWSDNVKIAQKNWIGKSEGALIKFKVKSLTFKAGTKNSKQSFDIEVFTTRPDTLFGATYLVIAPEHQLVEMLRSDISNIKEVEEYRKQTSLMAEADRIAEGKEKTGVRVKGIMAINPGTSEEIPVWVSDYVLSGVGTGAIMAVPAHDQRDFDFAKKFNLPIKMVVHPDRPAFVGDALTEATAGNGHLVDSGKFTGMYSEEAKWIITKAMGGRRKANFRLRDWLLSRQRYWGAPIPMIFCESCREAGRGEQKEMPGWHAVPEKDLPVTLPFIKNFRPTGTDKSPLASVEKFYKVRCPKCKSWARRETDVCDTFLDSAWYYIGYLMASGNWKLEIGNSPFSRLTRKWLPVDMYIGGAEHSVLHLLYVRFLAMAFHDWKIIPFSEPFTTFRSHGLITKDGAKMSKSKGNVVNPDEYIATYGTDTMRVYLAFMAPLNQGGDFRDGGIAGITRFLNRVWHLVSMRMTAAPQKIKNNTKERDVLERLLHKTIKKVGEDIESLQHNTAISALMILLNEMEAKAHLVSRDDIAIFLKLLAPFAPHITEELWQGHFAINYKLKTKNFCSIHREAWPVYKKKMLIENTKEIVVQINGKVRDTFVVVFDITEQEAVRLALSREKIKMIMSGQEMKKVIFVPGKLINIVF